LGSNTKIKNISKQIYQKNIRKKSKK